MSYFSGNGADPHQHPEMIPLDAWYSHRLQMVAECLGCGRVRIVNRAELIHRYGYGKCFDASALATLAPKLRCVHCDRREPRLTLQVVTDERLVIRQ